MKKIFFLIALQYAIAINAYAVSPATNLEGDTTKVYDVVEQMPSYPGGMGALMSYLSSHIKYPAEAEENGASGRVLVQFVVDTDGSVAEPTVTNSVHPALDKEAIRLVKSMPKWTPGTQEGKKVRCKFTLPITFRLTGTKPVAGNNASNSNALIFNQKAQVKYEGNIYAIDADVNIRHISTNLEKVLTKNMFGSEGILKDGLKKYIGQYKRDNSTPKRKMMVYIKADETYYNSETGLLCIRIFAPSEWENCSPSIAPVRYISYDVKKDKVITMPDLIDAPLQNHIKGQGINIDGVTDIESFGHLFIARADGHDIRMTPYKLYKHMTDYGLALAGLDRTSIEQGLTVANPDDVNKVYDSATNMPSFPGGVSALMRYLSSHIKYPVIAEENGIQGRVICTFIVERDGSITDVRVAKSIDPSLDKEAVRVIRTMPDWTPGSANGSFVRVKYTMPVTFRLQ